MASITPEHAVEMIGVELARPNKNKYLYGYLQGMAAAYWLADLISKELYDKAVATVQEEIMGSVK